VGAVGGHVYDRSFCPRIDFEIHFALGVQPVDRAVTTPGDVKEVPTIARKTCIRGIAARYFEGFVGRRIAVMDPHE